eukprot:TRINITY_DN10197_c4_g1_i1.p1 TRINITY_DN10197_c4_g1~~TRINITY_DN10197_c4_g1_i1.p1  ORF type:complete len:192 (+),score=27.49 TRINITY_DN10197_c4_g1_i1:52-627(+)
MELCGSAVKTLKAVSKEDSAVSKKMLAKIAEWTLKELIGESEGMADFGETDDLAARSIHSALCILYIEAGKTNSESSDIQDFLENQCGWADPDRISAVASPLYSSSLPHIREKLSSTTVMNPSVTEMQWRIDHTLGDRELDVPTKSRQRYEVNISLSDGEDLGISCTAEQMQIFAEKLRDMLAETHRVHNN